MSKIGVEGLTIYPLTADSESELTYGSGTSVPGTVNIDISPATNSNTLYADNLAYETAVALGEISVTIELADLPKAVQAVLLGHTVDTTTGELICKASDVAPYVGIAFKALKGNGACRYVKLCKGRFSDSDDSYSTKTDTPEFQTQSITGTFIARQNDKQWKRTIDSDDSDSGASATIAGWFTSFEG